MIEKLKAALATVTRKGLATLQAGPRSAGSGEVAYGALESLTPRKLAAAFSAADEGDLTGQSTLFQLIEEQDTHVFGELAKRRRSVTGVGWSITPKDDAPQAELDRVAELTDIVRDIDGFEDAHYDLTDAIGKGFTALEIEWATGDVWRPKTLHFVPQREFRTDRASGALQYLKNGAPEALREWGWVVHEHRAKSGYIEQAALFRVLAWASAFKGFNSRDMQRFLELYGMPLRLGKYPSGIGKPARDELLRAVRNIGHDGAGVVPSQMAIEFIQAQKGSVGDFLDAMAYWERKQSLAILGGTLTSQADGKSSTNALGEIHNAVRREIMLHDTRQVAPTITRQLLRPVALLNGLFAEDRMPTFSYQTEETVDQAKMADVLGKSAGLGMEIDIDWAHQAMQIPRAKPGATVLAQRPGPAGTALTRKAALAGAGPEGLVDAYSAQLAALCAPFEQRLIQKIGAVVAEAGDYEAALAGIEMLKSDPEWAEAMTQGMAAAHLAGRAEVA